MSKLKILIVDDEEDICDIYSFKFTEEGFETLTASNGDEAFKLIQEQNVDAVVSDVRMPKSDGVELLKKIKSLPNAPAVFLVSGFADISREKAIEEGAQDLLNKPINFPELIEAIKSLKK